MPRRRNLGVTDTLQWRPKAQLAQPANPCGIARRQLFVFVASRLWNQLALPGKRYAVREDLTTGGLANCPMRRDPFPARVKLTTYAPIKNQSVAKPTAWDNGIAA